MNFLDSTRTKRSRSRLTQISNSFRFLFQVEFLFSILNHIDQFVAEDSAVVDLISDLISRLHNGENLYIHCWGGHGRTGTIVACLLGKTLLFIISKTSARLFNLDAERALELTAKYHECRKKKKSRSPQSKCQFDQVRRLVSLNKVN